VADKISRILAGLCGAALLLSGLRWQIDPSAAAESLYMPLLEGAGRSTQVGDLTAFFVTGGILAITAAITRNSTLMLAPALLVGFAAFFRTLAWLVHGADLVVDLIVVEVIMLVIFLLAGSRFKTAS